MSTRIRVQLDDVSRQLGKARQLYAKTGQALNSNRQLLRELKARERSFTALGKILEHTDDLDHPDSIDLLWGEGCSEADAEQKRRGIEAALKEHNECLKETEQQIQSQLQELDRLEYLIMDLLPMQHDLQYEVRRIKAASEVLHGIKPVARPPTQIILPWSNKRSDAIRFRAIMLAALVIALLLGIIIPRWKVPEPERVEVIEIPERLATLIVKKAPPPPPPEVEARPDEEAEQPQTPEQESTQEETKARESLKTAEKTGLLAFKQDFVKIRDATAGIQLGSQAATAILTTAPDQRRTSASRSMIASRVELPGGSAAVTRVRRTDIIGGDNKLKKVEFTHIETSEAAALDRNQLASAGHRGKRSDEEIQVVFDRYKGALYRIYNRELRKNSFLKGKLVLKLTIQPDGTVSKCTVDYSNLNSAEFEMKITARVMRFNFGEKKGASALTILYPIDFLPAS